MSAEITIRAAVAGDASVLASLSAIVQELHFHGRPDVFKRADADGLTRWFTDTLAAGTAKIWIAEIGGGPAGYALVVEYRRPENVFCYERRWHEVEQVGVHPRFRSLGLGRELLGHIVRIAAESDVREVELNTWIFNTSAHHAFQRSGFATKNLRFARSTRQM